jgi:hypothetical protein
LAAGSMIDSMELEYLLTLRRSSLQTRKSTESGTKANAFGGYSRSHHTSDHYYENNLDCNYLYVLCRL